MSHAIRRPRPHAVWTEPLPDESGAPAWRTIHVVSVGLARRTGPVRIGVRPSLGYLHCGSRDDIDQVRDVRIHAWDGARWRVAHETRDLPAVPNAPVRGGSIAWLDGDWSDATGLRVEIRRSWVDDWWPSWNLADLGVVIEGADPEPFIDERDTFLRVGEVSLDGLPDGVTVSRRPEEVVFRTAVLEVGFLLASPNLSRLSFDPDGLPDRTLDLLRHAVLFTHTGNDLIIDSEHPLRGSGANGPRFAGVDGIEPLGSQTRTLSGLTTVTGPRVRYQVRIEELGLDYELTWTVEPDGLRLAVVRTGERDLVAGESSAWQLPLDAAAAISGMTARADRRGETGLATGPMLLHAPGWGNLQIETSGDILVRFDAYRPQLTTTVEVKVGELPGTLGEWQLPAGRHEGAAHFRVRHAQIPALAADTPADVRKGILRTAPSGLSFRLDTASLSNNYAAIHATFCMDYWANLAVAVGDALPGLSSIGLVTDSIDRHLNGAPGYGAGNTSLHPGRVEDEYLHTEVAVLLAAGVVASRPEGAAWVDTHATELATMLDRVRARDIDGDGLIEGELRRGRSGHREWATNWWDIISFGWKDAWLNALLYDALIRLDRDAPSVASRATGGAAAVREWAAGLRASFVPTFYNETTGWLAGWRTEDEQLHDHGYLFVTGAAVNAGLIDEELARSMVDRLWDSLAEAGFDQFALGLPGNTLPVPDAALAGALPNLPYGFYENGAATLSQARHFIGALQRVGRTADADRLLIAMLGRLADGTAFGGCSTGVDWRMWDGTRCGYEGLLTDQFGVLDPGTRTLGRAMSSMAARHQVTELRLDPPVGRHDVPGGRPWLDVTDPAGATYRVPTFLTTIGGVAARYASGVEGSHAYRWVGPDGVAIPDAPAGTIEVHGAPTAVGLLRHGPIRVAQGGRYFEHDDGSPFLWLGDTWWHALTPRISDDELRGLAEQRVAQGFTLIQLVVGPLPEVREFEPRGETVGGFAWEPGWTHIRPAFFDAADRRIGILLDAGLIPCIVGPWGYHMDDAGVDVMRAHWHELVARYAAHPVIWIVAGESSLPWYDRLFLPETPGYAASLAQRWAEVAAATRAIDPFHRPLTVHPSPGVDAYASVDVFPDTTLTDFQMLQTGHWDRGSLPGTMDTLVRIRADVPDQPVVNGEVNYEGIMGASWPDVQRYLWWAQVLAGAAGHTYGAQGLWGMNDGTFVGQVGSWGDATWREAAALPGSAHVGAARRWLSERPWAGMEPANDRLSPSASPDHWLRPFAARLTDGRLVCYLPGGAMLDNGTSDPRSYRIVTLRGFQPGAAVRLAYVEPRTMTTTLEERHVADASGAIVLERNMLAAMPSMEDWVLEAIPED